MKIKAKINPYPPTFNPQNGGDTKREKDRERDIEIERETRRDADEMRRGKLGQDFSFRSHAVEI